MCGGGREEAQGLRQGSPRQKCAIQGLALAADNPGTLGFGQDPCFCGQGPLFCDKTCDTRYCTSTGQVRVGAAMCSGQASLST